jgi:outer membrane protein assembly complex protein YaeT
MTRARRPTRYILLPLAVLSLLTGHLAAQQEEPRGLIVRGLSFDGNRTIDDNTLRISIATSQSSWFVRASLVSWIGLGAKRYFDETEFRRDVLRIRALYRQTGFAEATIDTLVRRGSDDVRVRFLIDEGEPISVTALRISGLEGILEVQNVYEAIPLKVGDPFNRLFMRASADSIRLRLADAGYPFAEVFISFDELRDRRTANVLFEVVPGTRARVEAVEITGTQKVSENVVRRAVAVEPGKVYRQRDLYQSQLNLYRAGIFNYVRVAPVDTIPSGPDDSLVTVQVQVSEGAMQRVRLGAGYGTIDCFRVLTSWSTTNLLGGGRRLELGARFSKIGAGDPLNFQRSVCPVLEQDAPERWVLNYNLSAALEEPFLFSRHFGGNVSAFLEQYTEFKAYVRQAVGGNVGVTYRTPWRMPVTVSYLISYGNTQADPATICALLNVCRLEDAERFGDNQRQGTLSLAVVRDRRNSIFNPTRGTLFSGEFRHASRLTFSDDRARFNKVSLEFSSYHAVGRRAAFAWRIRWGTIFGAGFRGRGVDSIPTEERFYLGGANTVRGFGQNEMGRVVRVIEGDTVTADGELRPITTFRTSPIGGNDLILMNAELRFPLGMSGRAFGAIFVDAGQMRTRLSTGEGSTIGDLSNLRITPGVGLRISSPLGPVRLDVAYNPYDPQPSPLYLQTRDQLIELTSQFQPKEPTFWERFRIHISIGQAF